MNQVRRNQESAELKRRIKKLATAITGAFQTAIDLLPFEWGRPGVSKSELMIEDLFEIAKHLDPNLKRDGERALAIYNAISKHSPKELDEMYNILTGVKYDAFRVGYFAGVLMGAHINGASPKRMRRLTARLHMLVLAEGFHPVPKLELASKTA